MYVNTCSCVIINLVSVYYKVEYKKVSCSFELQQLRLFADISNRQVLSAPTGIDVQGMLYFPPSTHGILETSHILVQGILKIDPPDNSETGRLTIKLIGDDRNIYLTPHTHNAMACDRFENGRCPMGKRPSKLRKSISFVV